MKINSLTYNKIYQNKPFKAQPYKNYTELKFNENDSEIGSVVAAIIGLGAAGAHIQAMKNPTSLKVTAIAGAFAIISALSTMGAITFAKMFKKSHEEKQKIQKAENKPTIQNTNTTRPLKTQETTK